MPKEIDKKEESFLDKLTFYVVIFIIGVNQIVDFFDNIMRFKTEFLELLKWFLQSTGADDFIREIILKII